MKKILNYISSIKFSSSKDLSSKELEDRAVFMGVIAELILSKELFKKNEDLKSFIQYIFEFQPLEYLFSSRTLLLSRIIRIIESAEKEVLNQFIISVNHFIENMENITYESKQSNSTNPKKGKKNTIDTIDSWRKVINRENE